MMQPSSIPEFDLTWMQFVTPPYFMQMNHSDPKCMLMNDYEGNHTGVRAYQALVIVYEWLPKNKAANS